VTSALWFFIGFIVLTLLITGWAARRSSAAVSYFAAGRRITGWQNGLAIAATT
jgi:cation/acetate symporter